MSLDTEARRSLLAELERQRSSKIIACFVSDRPGLQAALGEDAVRTLYDHVRALGRVRQLDLLLHSSGGGIDVPWRLVSLLREHCERLEVLVPHRAQSAATMVCLGADALVMGARAELGPVDAQIGCVRSDGEQEIEEQIGVEDLMAYLRFLRRHAGAPDGAAAAGLTEELPVHVIGQAQRMRTHVHALAGKLLALRAEPPDDATRHAIVTALSGRAHPHGHAIVRREARTIGLPVVEPARALEDDLWRFYEAFEQLCEVRTPFDARSFLGEELERRVEPVVLGCIESVAMAHQLLGEVKAVRQRQPPESISVDLRLTIDLTPAAEAAREGSGAAQRLSAELEPRVREAVADEVRRQLPALGVEAWIQGPRWVRTS